MAYEKNWLRTYTLKAGKAGAKGFEIGNTKSVDQTVLHISFSIEKSDAESSSETGLISIPKRITISKSSKKKKEQTGYEVQYFLNGAVGINDTVKIKTEKVNGYFRIYKVVHDGDNMEGDWVSTAQVIKL